MKLLCNSTTLELYIDYGRNHIEFRENFQGPQELGTKKQLRKCFILKMSSKSFEENIQLQDSYLFFSMLLVLRRGDSCSLTHSVLSTVVTRIFLFKDCGFLEEITKQSCGLTHFTLYSETISCLQNNTCTT
ncbi:hypothetical protein KIL84_016994 [Mauremys mutica]|uniref:Uncharacterized protein n=1 Tax=Mauremys mutica TaxID=74926 RepID=A0A9D3X5M5_9SAUR|nr:hypothetical protein KIL84_016994 [Mauremys mutica]